MTQEQKNHLMLLCSVVVETLHETDNKATPESTFYLALGMNLELWYLVRDVLIRAHMIQVKHHLVSLTPDGLNVAIRMQQAKNTARESRL